MSDLPLFVFIVPVVIFFVLVKFDSQVTLIPVNVQVIIIAVLNELDKGFLFVIVALHPHLGTVAVLTAPYVHGEPAVAVLINLTGANLNVFVDCVDNVFVVLDVELEQCHD